jgi:hypothetical protein
MQTSTFLAKLIGPVILLMGLVVVLDPRRMRTMAREMLQGEAFIFFAGLLSLPIGLAMVNSHNIWVWDWRVAITILGWMSLLAGIARIGLGSQVRSIGTAMVDSKIGLAVSGVLMGLVGAWLTWVGYLG